MPGPLCRLLIQHGPDSVDLALPRDALIGALLPSIVDLVHRGPVAAVEGRQWYLSRVGQEQFDEGDEPVRQRYPRWRAVVAHDRPRPSAAMDAKRCMADGDRNR